MSNRRLRGFLYILDEVKNLVVQLADRSKRSKENEGQKRKGRDSGRFLWLSEDRETELTMVLDPERSMYESAEVEKATGPAVEKVELFIAVSRTKEQGNKRILGGEDKDYRKLCQREKTYKE